MLKLNERRASYSYMDTEHREEKKKTTDYRYLRFVSSPKMNKFCNFPSIFISV